MVDDAIPGLVVLASIRKQAEQVIVRSQAAASFMASSSALASRFVPCLSSYLDFL